jgi:ribonuclease HI
MEVLKQNDIDTKSRVDAICDNFLPGVPMAFDHSITDPRQSGLSVKPIPGKAAKKREYLKLKKFHGTLARQGTRFGPFVLESYGRWGYRTRITFKELISKITQNSKLHACSLDKSVITHYWRCKITLAMHRQACLGMHSRIHVLQRHHQFKANLIKINVSGKVIQNKPFEHNSVIFDGSDKFASSYESAATNYTVCNLTDTTASLDKLSVSITDTNLSPLLQDSFDSELYHDTPAQQGQVNLFLSQFTHMPALTKHDNYHNDEYYTSLQVYTDGSCSMNNVTRLDRTAGWGVAIYMRHSNSNCAADDATTTDESILPLIELFGPVVTDFNSPFFLGAARHTNNTGELTAFGEAIIWLISNWKQICASISTPLKNIVIHSDSTYAINAIIGTESGSSNLQLYSNIRQLLREFKQSLQSSDLVVNGISTALTTAPTFSIRKVQAHAGIKGNEKADMLAQMGQHEVCNSGRYSNLPRNNSPTNYLRNTSKNSNPVSKFSLNDNSKKLEVTHIAHETSFQDQFPHFPSISSSLKLQSDSSPSSSSVSSTSSSPTLHPFGLTDY